MMKRKRPSISFVKATWDATPNPSVRKVANILSAGGRKISYSTVQAMKTGGWQAAEPDIDGARKQLEDAVRILRKGTEVLASEQPVTVEEVVGKGLRVLNGLYDEIERQKANLIANNTGPFGSLVKAVSAFQDSVVESHRQSQDKQPAPTVGSKPVEDPLKAALETWRAGSESDLKALKQ
jgi:glycerol-3-phosphate dehydrogenase